MKALVTAAVVALALMGCGGLTEEEMQLGTSMQAMVATDPPPVGDEPVRLSNAEVFSGTTKAHVSPDDPTFADRYHYVVDVKPPCR